MMKKNAIVSIIVRLLKEHTDKEIKVYHDNLKHSSIHQELINIFDHNFNDPYRYTMAVMEAFSNDSNDSNHDLNSVLNILRARIVLEETVLFPACREAHFEEVMTYKDQHSENMKRRETDIIERRSSNRLDKRSTDRKNKKEIIISRNKRKNGNLIFNYLL